MSYFFTNYMPRCCFCRTLALDLICFYLLLDWDSTGDEDSLPSREQRVVKQTVKLKMKSHKDLRFHKKNIENDKVQVYMCLFKMFQVYFLFAILSGLFFQSPFSRKKKNYIPNSNWKSFWVSKAASPLVSISEIWILPRCIARKTPEGYNELMQKWWQKLAMQKHPVFETSPTSVLQHKLENKPPDKPSSKPRQMQKKHEDLPMNHQS